MKYLIVYRHGERSDEAPESRKIDFECISDAPLTSVGHQQAEIAARSIHELIPENLSIHLVTSPLIRCVQTACKLAKLLKSPIFLEEGFGECYCQHHFPIDPFENLHLRIRPDMFEHTIEGVKIIENSHIVRPCNPENPIQLRERCEKMIEEYILKREEDVVIVCSHFMPLKVITELIGGHSNIESQHTVITAAEFNNGEFNILRNGCFKHLPRELTKPIPG